MMHTHKHTDHRATAYDMINSCSIQRVSDWIQFHRLSFIITYHLQIGVHSQHKLYRCRFGCWIGCYQPPPNVNSARPVCYFSWHAAILCLFANNSRLLWNCQHNSFRHLFNVNSPITTQSHKVWLKYRFYGNLLWPIEMNWWDKKENPIRIRIVYTVNAHARTYSQRILYLTKPADTEFPSYLAFYYYRFYDCKPFLFLFFASTRFAFCPIELLFFLLVSYTARTLCSSILLWYFSLVSFYAVVSSFIYELSVALRFILQWFVHWKEIECNSVDYSLVLYATRIFIL